MATTWFTADLHLGHAGIIRHCLRPYLSDAEETAALTDPQGKWSPSAATVRRHDDALLQAIDAHVGPCDVLWILGDFCWGDFETARRYRDRIRCGNVHLVWGNHDKRTLRPLFGEALEQGMISVDDQDIWLNHYPMRSWHRSFRGSWHLYGHVHGRLGGEDAARPWRLTRDVGVDACEYRPLGMPELKAYMQPRLAAFVARGQADESAEPQG